MIIENKKYVIATKTFPLLFDNGNGENVSDFEHAFLGSNKEIENILDTFDDPELYQTLEVKVTYEF